MLPVFALVGRPNVGKSTLFNCLTRSRDALVFDTPGITRDRLYGQGHYSGHNFLVIDTGGINPHEEGIDSLTAEQAWQGVEEAHVVFWLVDAQTGPTSIDAQLADRLRQLSKPVILVVNKSDHKATAVACNEFYQFGWPSMVAIAATHNKGIDELLATAYEAIPDILQAEPPVAIDPGIKVAIVGRPNVGKSTLVNRLLGEERVVVFDQPGTTRDSIFIPFTRREQKYTLIDTAGVRRRTNIKETIEKFSVVKTLQAISEAHVVIFMIDAQESVTEQDLNLLGFVLEAGRGLIIAINKWDGLGDYERGQIKEQIDRRLAFVDFADHLFISAKHGTGVGKLWEKIEKVYQCITAKHATSLLTQILLDAVTAHPPPLAHGRRPKLKYAHLGGVLPPRIVIHGNQTQALSQQYQRYLVNTFRKALKLVGTPIHLVLKSSNNPYG
ncbi:MAG: ribosome biogenesis GTPase Der [Gammaproteobacteria bacterium]